MLSSLLLLAFPAVQQDEPAPEPETPPQQEEQEEEKITPEKALDMLETAENSKQLDLIFIAIQDAGRVEDKKVAKAVGDFLKHKDSEVRYEALRALRYNEHPEATNVLLKQKKNKAILEDERAAEEYYLSLGQKRDKRAIKILADGLMSTNRGDKLTRARIVSLGRIREVDSVEALMNCLVSGGARRRHPQLMEIHTSLSVLTGAILKPSQDNWIAWWNDNKRGLKLTKEEQELDSKKARAAWMTLWATPEDKELMEAARKAGKDDFADATPEELEELRKKAEEIKRRREEGGDGADEDPPKKEGDGDGGDGQA